MIGPREVALISNRWMIKTLTCLYNQHQFSTSEDISTDFTQGLPKIGEGINNIPGKYVLTI